MTEIRAGKNDQGLRLDKFISRNYGQISRTKVQELILQNKVTVNCHAVTSAKYPVNEGDTINFSVPLETPVKLLSSVDQPVEIHFEDEHLLVVFKPAGLVTHPSTNHENDSLVHRLFGKTTLADNPENPIRPGIVHRLDKDTSGLLVIAKTGYAKTHLGNQFKEHTILRKYVALIWGKTKLQQGIINKKLAVHPVNRLKRTVSQKGKEAITHWQQVKTYPIWSIIVCKLQTGRTHQIRVHLSSEGYGIIGDKLYGAPSKLNTAPENAQRIISGYEGQFLHAYQLGFIHPARGIPLNFYRRPPRAFLDLACLHEPLFRYETLLA